MDHISVAQTYLPAEENEFFITKENADHNYRVIKNLIQTLSDMVLNLKDISVMENSGTDLWEITNSLYLDELLKQSEIISDWARKTGADTDYIREVFNYCPPTRDTLLLLLSRFPAARPTVNDPYRTAQEIIQLTVDVQD